MMNYHIEAETWLSFLQTCAVWKKKSRQIKQQTWFPFNIDLNNVHGGTDIQINQVLCYFPICISPWWFSFSFTCTLAITNKCYRLVGVALFIEVISCHLLCLNHVEKETCVCIMFIFILTYSFSLCNTVK